MTTLTNKLEENGYIPEAALTTTLELMETLGRPLLLEGEAGVGKTSVAYTLAKIHDCELIRLQCYEGLDVQSSVYEWNYSKQLLSINLGKESNNSQKLEHVFSEEFLLERPLLKAIRQSGKTILLIDEIDRADEAFEAFLLELLSEFQISIPEFGTVKANIAPYVILTSNGTRELSDALRRRCLYHYLDYPTREREASIIQQAFPEISKNLNKQIVGFIQGLRKQELRKNPGIAETLDWTAALTGLGVKDLLNAEDAINNTLGCILKTQEDIEYLDQKRMDKLLSASA